VVNVLATAGLVRPYTEHLLAMARAGDEDLLTGTYDQAAFNQFFNGLTSGIVSKGYNWRIISGLAPRAHVLHMQGIKCESLLCDPPSGDTSGAVVGGTLDMKRVGVKVACNDTGTSWRKHDTLFLRRAVGGMPNTLCGYEFACKRAFVDASFPHKCGAFAGKPKRAATGFGFAPFAFGDGDCGEARATCDVFAATDSPKCPAAGSTVASALIPRVPPALRVEATKAVVQRCNVAVGLILDARVTGNGPDALLGHAMRTVKSASAFYGTGDAPMPVAVVIVAVTAEEAATFATQVQIASAKLSPNVAVFIGNFTEAAAVRVAGAVAGNAADFARVSSLFFGGFLHAAGLLGELSEATASKHPCPGPFVLLTHPGVRFVRPPSAAIWEGAVLPTYTSLVPRCPGTPPWALGASANRAGLATVPSSVVSLLNVLPLAGMTDAARGFVEAVRGGAQLPAGFDALRDFVANAAVALPASFLDTPSSIGSGAKQSSVLQMPADNTLLEADWTKDCSAKASVARWAQPVTSESTACSRKTWCARLPDSALPHPSCILR
jgi:hypothetical protein